jgi:hypothetical protein
MTPTELIAAFETLAEAPEGAMPLASTWSFADVGRAIQLRPSFAALAA